MPVVVPRVEEVRESYTVALELVPKTHQVESAYLKARGKADFGNAIYSPIYHHVSESPTGTVYRIVGNVFIEYHKEGQQKAIGRRLEEIRRFIQSAAAGRKVTCYIDWAKVEDEPEGTNWMFGLKAIFATA